MADICNPRYGQHRQPMSTLSFHGIAPTSSILLSAPEPFTAAAPSASSEAVLLLLPKLPVPTTRASPAAASPVVPDLVLASCWPLATDSLPRLSTVFRPTTHRAYCAWELGCSRSKPLSVSTTRYCSGLQPLLVGMIILKQAAEEGYLQE